MQAETSLQVKPESLSVLQTSKDSFSKAYVAEKNNFCQIFVTFENLPSSILESMTKGFRSDCKSSRPK